jgi:hypothetical protein
MLSPIMVARSTGFFPPCAGHRLARAMQADRRMKRRAIALVAAVAWAMAGCGDAASQDVDAEGDVAAAASSEQPLAAGADRCRRRSPTLSPKGLTLVLHISKHGANGVRAVRHLERIKKWIRDRDIFMVEETGPLLQRLHKAFPCNKIHYIAYPSEMKKALGTGGLIDGISVDWEGGQVESHSVGYSADRLRAYAHDIRHAGKQPSFVPAWTSRFDDATVAKSADMAYELAQIQGACVNGPRRFANAAHALVRRFRDRGLGARNVGFEVSMNSFNFAPNHVGPARAARCTRSAYGKGARAIYIYGNGPDHFVDYFRALGHMGLRKPG